MNSRSSVKRIVALEIRASKIGFAAFEGPSRLLDWGLRSVGNGVLNHIMTERIGTLIEFYRPSIVVVRERGPKLRTERNKLRSVLTAISRETQRSSVRFAVLSGKQFRAFFASYGVRTKYAIATQVAQRFDELSWKLPRRRKTFESESPSLAVFDAVATGVAYLER